MYKTLFLITLFSLSLVVTNESFAQICTPNNPEDCANIADSGSAPHMSGIRNCEGITFGNTVGDVICGMSNTEIFIHAGQATQRTVPIFYNGFVINTIDVGATPTGLPHEESLSIGGQIASLPFWMFYEVSNDGTLLHKGNGYQHVFRDNNNEEFFEDPDNTIQRQLNSAKIKHHLFHLWN